MKTPLQQLAESEAENKSKPVTTTSTKGNGINVFV
jgi:hypothetical protein